jgi:monoamine oxidase
VLAGALAGLDVHVCEACDHVAGRVWTQRGLPGGQVVERGGEFIDSRHDAMRDLVAPVVGDGTNPLAPLVAYDPRP